MKSRITPYLFIFLIFILAYFPIVSFIAGVKNDILTGYLPVRFFMSESLSAGYIPWWNPYVNFGIPQYADMSCSFWSPITWIIASTVGYNVYTITIELLFYILMAGWGMYKCGDIFNWNKNARIVAATAFMCSGFITGHLQHLNWISGAAFLPWCLWAYENLLKRKSINDILIAVFCFYFLLSSAHPGIIIGSIYFFFLFTIYRLCLINKNQKKEIWAVSSKRILPFFILLVLMSAAMIYSYAEILPFISRGNKIFTDFPKQNATTFNNWISFLFPFTTVKSNHIFTNEPTLRNCYFGVILLAFGFSSILSNWRKNIFFAAAGVFFLLLSANSLIQVICYKYLPLFGYVRLNGEFRLFAIFAFIIISASALSDYLNSRNVNKPVLYTTKIFLFIYGAAFIWSLYEIIFLRNSFLFSVAHELHKTLSLSHLKYLLNSLSFGDLLLLQSVFTILILLPFYKSIKGMNIQNIFLLIIIDLAISAVLQLPFTGVGTKSTNEIQSYLNQSPHGIPIPKQQAISLNDTGAINIEKILGKWSFYNKQPGNISKAPYPIEFKTEDKIYSPEFMSEIKNSFFIFYKPFSLSTPHKEEVDSSAISKIEITKFSPNEIILNLNTREDGTLNLLYKNYKHWNVSINGKECNLEKYKDAFYKLKINSKGNYTIHFGFDPKPVEFLSLITLTSFILIITLLLISLFKKNHFQK